MKRYPEALKDYLEGLRIAEATAFLPLEISCTSNIGHVYSLQGEHRKALPYHLKAQRLIEASGQLEKSVDISLWKDDSGKLCLKVADNGVGKTAASDPKKALLSARA